MTSSPCDPDLCDTLAVAFNAAIRENASTDGKVDVRAIMAACMTIVEAYVVPVEKGKRIELVSTAIELLEQIREGIH